jgi:outer membrane lipoprotein-sorting protein
VSFIRRTSRNRLLAVITALIAIGVASVALAAGPLAASTTTPPAKPLAQALADAVAAPAVQGVTARIQFTNTLIGSDIVPGSSPLLSGATGRLWATNDGRFRLELQGQAGDAQILGDGTAVTVIQPGNATAYRFVLPARTGGTADTSTADTPPTAADIQQQLDKLAGVAIVSPAAATSVAGQPAYEVRLAPAQNGGLLGAVALAWDAAKGIPLRIGIYARGATDPTLELTATDISYGPVSSDALNVPVPAGVKVQTVDLGRLHHDRTSTTTPDAKTPETVAQVQASVGFQLQAPDAAAGLPRTSVHTVGDQTDGKASALVVYGHGLGSILVLEQQADPANPTATKPGGIDLPSVSIAGAPGSELSTALGSIVRVTKDGVTTTVVGSVPAAAAEAAAGDVVSA